MRGRRGGPVPPGRPRDRGPAGSRRRRRPARRGRFRPGAPAAGHRMRPVPSTGRVRSRPGPAAPGTGSVRLGVVGGCGSVQVFLVPESPVVRGTLPVGPGSAGVEALAQDGVPLRGGMLASAEALPSGRVFVIDEDPRPAWPTNSSRTARCSWPANSPTPADVHSHRTLLVLADARGRRAPHAAPTGVCGHRSSPAPRRGVRALRRFEAPHRPPALPGLRPPRGARLPESPPPRGWPPASPARARRADRRAGRRR